MIECSGSSFGAADAMCDLTKGGRLLQMGILGYDAEWPYDLVIYKELRISVASPRHRTHDNEA
ncbi:hypothetical protein [Microvirga zambiensis]|uniref:hypothetical protein n=1 Tax=Microvirga zambiensis TaxID=1402137 RepID=UPI00191D931B|nr:hypothetical protein [Microvirga zambiensis]